MTRAAHRRQGTGPNRRGLFRTGGRLPYNYLAVWGSRALAVYDFGVASSLSLVGAGIATMSDLSGRGNTLTGTLGARPTYTASDPDFNGQACGTGDGVNQTLRRAAMQYGAAQPTFTQIVVLKSIGLLGWACSAVNQCGFLTTGAGQFQTTVIGATSTGAQDFRTRARCGMVLAPGGTYTRIVDRVAGAPVAYAGSINNAAQGTLFSSVAPSNFLNGKIAFYALISGALSASEVSDFQNYATARWGVL